MSLNLCSSPLQAYDAVQSFAAKPVTAGVNLIYEEENTNTHTSNSDVVASSILATNSLTLNATNTLEIAGSDVGSADALTVNAETINIHASQGTYSTETSSETKNASVGLYGTNMGQATIGYQENEQTTTGIVQRNATLFAGGTANITSTGDTTLAGANVQAANLNVNVGGDLNMESLQDTQHIDGSSRGGSVSGGLTGITGLSLNGGETSGDKAWVANVTSLNGSDSINVNVGGTTTLTGASISNVDANGVDQGNLELTTQNLVLNDIKDSDTYESSTVSVGVSTGKGSTPELNSAGYTNNTTDKEQITRATIGTGTINTDTTTGELNRDVDNIQSITKDESSNTELYGSDKTLDLLNPETDSIGNLGRRLGDVGLASHVEILNNLPTGDGKTVTQMIDGKEVTINVREDGTEKSALENFIDDTIGEVLDGAGTLGITPSVGNDGGYVTQIATQLFGDNRNVIVVKDRDKLIGIGIDPDNIKEVTKKDPLTGEMITVYVTDPDKAVQIDVVRDENDPLNDHKIYVSSEDIQSMGLEHLFTNGMFNDTDTAIVNQQTQQGGADGILNYNQQHGVVGDMIQNIQDHLTSNLGLGSLGTGSSYQTGEVIEQMTSLNNGHVVIGAHSQGTMMTQNGLDQHQENLSAIVQANTNSVFQVQYSGAPVNYRIGADMITSIYGGNQAIIDRTENENISDIFRSHVAPQDFVGTVLGMNSAGVNNSENLGANIIGGLIGMPLLFGLGGVSPHSYYPCIIGCGEERSTPTKDYFYENNNPSNQEVPLTDDYTNRLPHVNQGLLPQSREDSQDTPQSILDTTRGK